MCKCIVVMQTWPHFLTGIFVWPKVFLRSWSCQRDGLSHSRRSSWTLSSTCHVRDKYYPFRPVMIHGQVGATLGKCVLAVGAVSKYIEVMRRLSQTPTPVLFLFLLMAYWFVTQSVVSYWSLSIQIRCKYLTEPSASLNFCQFLKDNIN